MDLSIISVAEHSKNTACYKQITTDNALGQQPQTPGILTEHLE